MEYKIVEEIKWTNGFYDKYYLILYSISIKNIIIQYQINFFSKGIEFYCNYCKSYLSEKCKCRPFLFDEGFNRNNKLMNCDYINNAINIYNHMKCNIGEIKYLSKKDLWIWLSDTIKKEYSL